MLLRSLLMAAGLLLSTVAVAQQSRIVPTSEFYFDADAGTTRPVVAIEDQGQQLVDRLLDRMRSQPEATAATAQLAHLAMTGGRPELGRELYQRALGWLDTSDSLYRPVLWNYGWDLYRLGEHEAAFEQWHALLRSRNVHPAWMPQTFALALWTLGRKDEAVQWYAAAVRTEPTRWSSGQGYDALLPDWTGSERALLLQVHEAWAANPPAWR